jgi:hypothetical protein
MELEEFRYVVSPKDKIKEVDTKIKKKISDKDKRFASQSVFLFAGNKLLNRGTPPSTQKYRSTTSTTSTRTSRMTSCTSTSPTCSPSDEHTPASTHP